VRRRLTTEPTGAPRHPDGFVKVIELCGPDEALRERPGGY
jgi:hypothetical protein